jgi:hypothetical protein
MNKRPKTTRLWAVTYRGRIVVNKENHLRPMLIFDRKWRAENAVWRPGEKVVEVRVSQ